MKNFGGRAIIFFQTDSSQFRIILCKTGKDFRVTSPETVDRLIRIPYHKQLPAAPAPLSDQTVLKRIDVLKFVN